MKKGIFLSIIILVLGWGGHLLAAPCAVSRASDFQGQWSAFSSGRCQTGEERWLEMIQPYFHDASQVSVLHFTNSLNIKITSGLRLEREGAPALIVAPSNITVRFSGSQMSGKNPGLTIKRSNVMLSNLIWEDFPGTALVLMGDEIQLINNEIKGNGYNGVIITDKKWPATCRLLSNRRGAKNISLIDNHIHDNGKLSSIDDVCENISSNAPENILCQAQALSGSEEPSPLLTGYGIVVDGYQVRIEGSEIGLASIHHNLVAGIFFQSYSAPYLCREDQAGFDPVELLHTMRLSKVSFYENGLEGNNGGILTRGPLFPSPAGLTLTENGGDRWTISGAIPFSRDPKDPWSLGLVSPRNVEVEIYASPKEEIGEGKTYLGVVQDVASDGAFQITIPKENLSSEDIALTAIATDKILNVSSPFSLSYPQGDNADADQDGLSNQEEDRNGNGRVDDGESDPRNPDTDFDGASDGIERELGLNPTNPDTDSDCLPDGLELGVTKETILDLRKRSQNLTGILSLQPACRQKAEESGMQKPENGIWIEGAEEKWENIIGLYDLDPVSKSNPAIKDSDQDSLEDGEEDKNLNGRKDEEECDPIQKDSDHDELDDGDEILLETDPANPDTDGDGAKDGFEVHHARSNPKVCDTDGDGLGDGLELGVIHPKTTLSECRGLQEVGTNFQKIRNLDPTDPDSDQDGLTDGEEDLNQNGWLDFNETDPTASDSDEDGLEDGFEKNLGEKKGGLPFNIGQLSNGEKCSPPPDKGDIDCDGFVNARDIDSDNDGCLDSEEGKKDLNENGILDLWETSVKGCALSSSSGSSRSSPSIGTGDPSEPIQQNKGLSPSVEVLPAKGGGACQLIPSRQKRNLVEINYIIFLLMFLFVGRFSLFLGVRPGQVL